jgi:hypothetical protein
MKTLTIAPVVLLSVFGVACAADSSVAPDESNLASNQAALYDFEFDGEVLARSYTDSAQAINDQVIYTIGQLNGDLRGAGRLDKLKLTNIVRTELPGAKVKIAYHAVLPVGVGTNGGVPANYALVMPNDVSSDALTAFALKYTRQNEQERNIKCAAWEGHALSADNFWYYYRPNQAQCKFEEKDITRIKVAAKLSTENTVDKYPEYDRIWEDNTLSVVAIYGRYEDGSTGTSDPNIGAYSRFHTIMGYSSGMLPVGAPVSMVGPRWQESVLDTTDITSLKLKAAKIPEAPDDRTPFITREGTMKDGRKIRIDSMLVDGQSLRASRGQRGYNAAFDGWYNQRSREADLIVYTGHAGLGSNVRALTKKGEVAKGKYQIVFMDGCDTFAYVDGFLGAKKSQVNPDDPNGTKYLDMMTTLMPVVPSWAPPAFASLVGGLTSTKPMTYAQIFRTFSDKDHVVVVTGEEDNTFKPAAK